jgi:hypothetical protein
MTAVVFLVTNCGAPGDSCDIPVDSCGAPGDSCDIPVDSCGAPGNSCGVFLVSIVLAKNIHIEIILKMLFKIVSIKYLACVVQHTVN